MQRKATLLVSLFMLVTASSVVSMQPAPEEIRRLSAWEEERPALQIILSPFSEDKREKMVRSLRAGIEEAEKKCASCDYLADFLLQHRLKAPLDLLKEALPHRRGCRFAGKKARILAAFCAIAANDNPTMPEMSEDEAQQEIDQTIAHVRREEFNWTALEEMVRDVPEGQKYRTVLGQIMQAQERRVLLERGIGRWLRAGSY